MKFTFLIPLFLLSLFTSSCFSRNKIVLQQFLEEKSLYDISAADTLIVDRIDFDLKRVRDTAYSKSACRKRALEVYKRIRKYHINSCTQTDLFDKYYGDSSSEYTPTRDFCVVENSSTVFYL